MKNKSNFKKKTQLLEISKQIFHFKKISSIENMNLFQQQINDKLSKTCIEQHKFLFCKEDIQYLLHSSKSHIDHLIDKHEINIAQNRHKKVITFSKFLIYFAIPNIIDYHKNKNL